MMSIQKIREDIKSLIGAEVHVFGQPTTLSSEVPDGAIDILVVLDELEQYEKDLNYDLYNEETDEYVPAKFESVQDFVDYMEDELGQWKEIKHDNTYNWSSPVSHDIDFKTFKDIETGNFYIQLMVHRYGDVRGNYTDYALLEFDYEEGFLYALMECNKEVDMDDEHYARIDILSDSYEIYTHDGEYVKTIYSLDDYEKGSE